MSMEHSEDMAGLLTSQPAIKRSADEERPGNGTPMHNLGESGEGSRKLSFCTFSLTSAKKACQVDPPKELQFKDWPLADLTGLMWHSNKGCTNDQLTPSIDPALFSRRWGGKSEYALHRVRCLVAMLVKKVRSRMLPLVDTLTEAKNKYLVYCSKLNEALSKILAVPSPGRSP